MKPFNRFQRLGAAIACAVIAGFLLAPNAFACSKSDTSYLDSFLDSTCLQAPLTNLEIDAFGGLRLAANGTPSTSTWDTDTDFNSGITYQSTPFPPVNVSTLATTGSGSPATLTLPTTLLPLSKDAANPVLSPTASTAGDNDNVDDPTVSKVGSTYVMWYSGTAEDGGPSEIFEATSTDGRAWTRANGGLPVLSGTSGAFDTHGVFGPDVIYDPTNLAAPYKMWYSGKGDVFGAIGYATSTDGVNWTKYDANSDGVPDPVLDHGTPGGADSFAAADPSVLLDGSTWKMWYTADDSNKKRIAYATSPDGITWSKGGSVIAPEDPTANANYQFGAFAPTVYKVGNNFEIILGGRKLVSGTTFQTKLLGSTSSDGIHWPAPSPVLNPFAGGFDASNLSSPSVLSDPTDVSAPYKLYYSGNALDANGNFHTRIGLATGSNGTSFSRFGGSGFGASVLDISPLTSSEPLDARTASGLSVVAPASATPKFVGFYSGNRGEDFLSRLGEATSADASSWTKVVGGATGGALFDLGSGSAFDAGGEQDPGALYDSGTYDLYFTGVSSGGTDSIGLATSAQDATTKLPTTWSSTSQLLTSGSGFDASGVSHPSVIKDGSAYVMYYTGHSSGAPGIGRVTSTAASGPFNTSRAQVLTPGAAGTFDHNGVEDPVVVKVTTGDYRMVYTGLETVPGVLPGETTTIERIGYATSTDGISWAKQSVPVLNASQVAYADDELGVDATGMLVDGSTLDVFSSGIDRSGRLHADHATTAFPTPVSPVAGLPNGWSTYQLGDDTTPTQVFKSIQRTSSGGTVTVEMSFLQPYSSAGNDFWSSYFPVTLTNNPQTLNFLNTVTAVRWQVRESGPSGSPALDRIDIVHAPVSYATAGNGTTTAITPPSGEAITAWQNALVTTSGGAGGGTVTVSDPAAPATALASGPLNTSGQTTIDLSAISPASHPSLEVRFDLTGPGTSTPIVQSLDVSYTSVAQPTAITGPASAITDRSASLGGTVNPDGVATTYDFQYGTTTAYGAQTAPVIAGSGTTNVPASAGVLGLLPSTTYHYRLVANTVSGPSYGLDATFTTLARPLLTLRKTTRNPVFGSRVILTGKLTQGAVTLGRQKVTILAEPNGKHRFSRVGSASTNSKGVYSLSVKPQRTTTYEATFADAVPKRLKVGLAQLVTLSVVRKGGKAYFKGAIAPSHPHRPVVIQVLKHGRWKTLAKLKSTARSKFTLVEKLSAKGKFKFRATTPADRNYLAGVSKPAAVGH